MMAPILGISPGTRQMGLAVIEQGELIDFRMYRFPGKWSASKQESIITRLSRYINQYHIEVVVIKTIHPKKHSTELKLLLDASDALFQDRSLVVHRFTIDELKEYILSVGGGNKVILGEQLSILYPEVTFAVRKEKSNLNPYHEKVFEAVALAHIVVHIKRQ